MEEIHRKALQKTRTKLVRDLDPSCELQDQLVSEHIFTPIMLEYIQAERTRSDRVRRLLDDLVRRGPRAYSVFLKCLRESGHEDLANSVEDKEYELRGIPPPVRLERHSEGASVISTPTTIYNREQGPAVNPVNNGIQPSQPSGVQPQEYQTMPHQPSDDNNPYSSMFAPSGASMSQQLANQGSDMSHVTPGQRSENVMEVVDGGEPQTTAEPVMSAYQMAPENRRYKMESTPRGLCFIINNKNYVNMPICEGTDVNRDQLSDLFTSLSFGVETKNDLTGAEMKSILSELTRYEGLTIVDSLVVCLLCHGDSDNVYGIDGEAVNLLSDVFKIFGPQTCQPMIGKPKLFVLNSCRGRERDFGSHFSTVELQPTVAQADVTLHPPSNVPDVRPTTQLTLPETNPSFKDLYIAYSTFQGHVSYLDSEDGSWFIQKLVEVFKEEASLYEIDIMMREVNRRVASDYDASSLEVQMPSPSNTLTRQWFFNPPQQGQ